MTSPLKYRLVGGAAAVLLIFPAVLARPAASADPAPSPDPASAYCQRFGTESATILGALENLGALDGSAAQDVSAQQTAAAYSALGTALRALLTQGSPPAYLSGQLQEQADYWSSAADAVRNGQTASALLAVGRVADEMGKLVALAQATGAYCGLDDGLSTPPPVSSNPYCQRLGAGSLAILSAFQDLVVLSQSAPADTIRGQSGAIYAAMGTAMRGLLTQGSPPSSLADQLKEQVDYWTSAADAVNRSTASALLTDDRVMAEMAKVVDVMEASRAFCDQVGASPTASTESIGLTSPKLGAEGLSVDGAKSTTPVTVTLTGTGTWAAKADSGQKWLTVERGSGRSGDQFSVVVKKNTGAARSGSITVSQGTDTKKLKVSQSGKAVISATLVTRQPVSAAGDDAVQVRLKLEPAGSTDSAKVTMPKKVGQWVHFVSNSSGTLTLKVEANTGKKRSGKVTITVGNSSTTVTVSQNAG